MQALTPVSADLPPLGELVAAEPFWRYPAGREGVAHLRVWTTMTDPPWYVAAVTETGRAACVTESAGRMANSCASSPSW
jgi:hypothetical protein